MINSKIIANGILKSIGQLALILLLIFFLYKIQLVIIYLIVAIILTLIGIPIQRFLKKRFKFNNLFATITTILFFFSIVVGFILLFVPLIASQGQSLSLLNTAAIENNFNLLIQQATTFLESHNIDGSKMLKQSSLTSKVNFNFVSDFLNIIVGTISSFGMGLASVMFITFFLLKDKAMFISNIKDILPINHQEKILNSLEKINALLSRYFTGILIQMFIVFIFYLTVLLIFGVENALIIAFLCAILNIIPYIGALIGAIAAALLTMIGNLGSDFQTHILPTTIYVLIGFFIVHLIDSNIFQPIIFSKSVKSHPVEIFLVILCAGFLFGIMGMIIAVPLFTILKVIGKEFFPNNKLILAISKNI